MLRRTSFVLIVQLLFLVHMYGKCLQGDCISGFGIYQFKSGATYKGHFLRGQIEGHGTLFLKNGDRYTGEWRQNKRHGQGTYWFENGNIYRGAFEDGDMQGQGKMRYADGRTYEGRWKNNVPHGQGIMVFTDESEYEGSFQNGYREGFGKMYYSDGRIYKGQWKHDKKHGTGTLYLHEGQAVNGTWHTGVFTGKEVAESKTKSALKDCNREYCHLEQGRYVYADGSVYEGEFRLGKPEGEGSCHYDNGNIYIGAWKNHVPHGMGILTLKDGTVIRRQWENGYAAGQYTEQKPSRSAVRAEADVDDVRIYALLIGISRYDHMPSLKFTDDDAYRLYAFFKSPEGGALEDKQMSILVDETATRQRILEELDRLGSQADGNDVLLVYYSGHGLRGSFLPFDYDGYHNKIAHKEVMNILNHSPARQKVLLADACHSGGLPYHKGKTRIELHPFYEAFRHAGGGTALFLSSRADEVSLEDHGLRQGIFSHFLLKGLKGEADRDKNKLVNLEELSQYVQNHVRQYTNGRQHPVIHGDIDPKIPLALIR